MYYKEYRDLLDSELCDVLLFGLTSDLRDSDLRMGLFGLGPLNDRFEWIDIIEPLFLNTLEGDTVNAGTTGSNLGILIVLLSFESSISIGILN